MTISLTLLCAIAGDDTSEAVFDDGALSERGLPEAGATRGTLPRYSVAVRAPSTRCAQTAHALALKTTLEPALRDVDYGKWRGRTAAEVAATDPYGFSTWMTDPDATPRITRDSRGCAASARRRSCPSALSPARKSRSEATT